MLFQISGKIVRKTTRYGLGILNNDENGVEKKECRNDYCFLVM